MASRYKDMTTPYTPENPILPCPTSPIQQTSSEAIDFTGSPQDWHRHRNDTISDRVGGNSDGGKE